MKPQSETSGEQQYGREQEKLMSDLADKTMKNFEQAMRTGLKLQEEAVQFWAKAANQSPSVQDLQKRFANATSIASGVVPEAQKRIEELIALAEKNGRTALELMKKAADAAQTPVWAESQVKWVEFWTDSLKGAQNHVQALTEIGSRSVGCCVEFARKNTEWPKAA
jgi:hypothetical protein